MPDKTWKAVERAVAERFGGKRVGQYGAEDVDAGWLAIEVKHRKKLPEWLIKAVAQAQGHAGEKRLGIVVLHELGKHAVNNLVVMSEKDFHDWIGK